MIYSQIIHLIVYYAFNSYDQQVARAVKTMKCVKTVLTVQSKVCIPFVRMWRTKKLI